MEEISEQPKFAIKPIIEQKPFENPSVRLFFIRWCEINDSIEPQFLPRDEWQQKAQRAILDKTGDGKFKLYVPKDLHLWEMMGIIESVDANTFADNPDRRVQAKNKILTLGKLFRNSGIYIAKRLDAIIEGKSLAKGLTEEFYDYGKALMTGQKSSQISTAQDIANIELSPQETEEVDQFLAGKNLYKARQKKVQKISLQDMAQKSDAQEQMRKQTLAQFFRISQKAYKLSENWGTLTKSKPAYPWLNDAPIHWAFLKKIEDSMTRKIESPQSELTLSIFHRGMELLRKYMPFDKLPPHIKNVYLSWNNGEKTLREALKIHKLKAYLEESKKSGNAQLISRAEKIIADKIQTIMSSYLRKIESTNPSEIVNTQQINCVGASLLGGTFMQETGLSYLVGDAPDHSVLFLITSNGQVELRDMLNPQDNEALTDEAIKGKNQDGSPLTVAGIVAFSKHPSPEGIYFYIEDPNYHKKRLWPENQKALRIGLLPPETGQFVQVLNNAGTEFFKLNFFKEACVPFRELIKMNPRRAESYNNLGLTMDRLKNKAKAIDLFRQSIALSPENYKPYANLANTYNNLGWYDKAEAAYRKVISLNKEYDSPYYDLGSVLFNLKRYDEAIKVYEQYIQLADKEKDEYYINRAKEMIAKCKQKNNPSQ